LPAPLKLTTPGNHDFTMDLPVFRWKVRSVNSPLKTDLVEREYGKEGEAVQLIRSPETKEVGIVLLDQEARTLTHWRIARD
jgi:hypothetical protein